MGPEDSEKKVIKVCMMVDGQPVEISPEIVEITYSEDKQSNDILDFGECEITYGQGSKEEIKRQTKILIADELDESVVGAMARAIRYLADCMERETREIEEVARMIAERTGVSMEAAEGMVLNVLQRDAVGLRECLEELNSLFDEDSGQKGELLDLKTAWDRKGAREKLRAIERENVSRFRQYKAKESTWAARKRTGPRQREWRGPWRDAKRTN